MMMEWIEYRMFMLTVRMSRYRDALQQFAYGTDLSPPIEKSANVQQKLNHYNKLTITIKYDMRLTIVIDVWNVTTQVYDVQS
jgi:hypothetical protein